MKTEISKISLMHIFKKTATIYILLIFYHELDKTICQMEIFSLL